MLSTLRQRACFGLVSDGPYLTQLNKFAQLGLRAFIDRPMFTSRLGAPKPAPDAFIAFVWLIAGLSSACQRM